MNHVGSLLLGELEAIAENGPDCGGHYRNFHDLVVREGRVFEPRSRPLTIPQLAPRNCFFNSLLLAAVRGFPYVEGFAVAGPVPTIVCHAWNVDPRGRAIDATWPQPGIAYVGIPFSAQRADNALWDGDSSVLQDDRETLLHDAWQGEESPGDTVGLLDKMARQTWEHPPFGFQAQYADWRLMLADLRSMAYGTKARQRAGVGS